jgi:hypothetical protein
MKTEYPSARDPWLMLLLYGAPLGVVLFGGFLLTSSVGAGIYAMLTGGVIGGIVAALSFPCVYVVSDVGVRIRCGIFDEDVPLAKIRSVKPSWSLWAAPALSLRRVKITFDHGSCLISPRDREGFIADLEARLKAHRPE